MTYYRLTLASVLVSVMSISVSLPSAAATLPRCENPAVQCPKPKTTVPTPPQNKNTPSLPPTLPGMGIPNPADCARYGGCKPKCKPPVKPVFTDPSRSFGYCPQGPIPKHLGAKSEGAGTIAT